MVVRSGVVRYGIQPCGLEEQEREVVLRLGSRCLYNKGGWAMTEADRRLLADLTSSPQLLLQYKPDLTPRGGMSQTTPYLFRCSATEGYAVPEPLTRLYMTPIWATYEPSLEICAMQGCDLAAGRRAIAGQPLLFGRRRLPPLLRPGPLLLSRCELALCIACARHTKTVPRKHER